MLYSITTSAAVRPRLFKPTNRSGSCAGASTSSGEYSIANIPTLTLVQVPPSNLSDTQVLRGRAVCTELASNDSGIHPPPQALIGQVRHTNAEESLGGERNLQPVQDYDYVRVVLGASLAVLALSVATLTLQKIAKIALYQYIIAFRCQDLLLALAQHRLFTFGTPADFIVYLIQPNI